MWTDSKGGFTWCVYSSWVSFSTSISCLKCESWSPIPYKAPFSWYLNRTLGFVFSVKFMFCLFPCFHPKPRDIWLLKKCLSRRGAGFKRLVCAKGGLPFPVTPPACWSKPHSFLHFKKVVWWWQDDIQSLLFCEHKIFRNIVPSCWRLTLSGEMRRTRWEDEVKCPAPKCLTAPLLVHCMCSSASPPHPSPACFLPRGPPTWTALVHSGSCWLPLGSASGEAQQETGGEGEREIEVLIPPSWFS